MCFHFSVERNSNGETSMEEKMKNSLPDNKISELSDKMICRHEKIGRENADYHKVCFSLGR